MRARIVLAMVVLTLVSFAGGAELQPVVSNVQVAQRAGTKLVDITYDLSYGGGAVTIWIDVSNDGGRSYIVPAKTFSGHIGQGVSPGNNKAVVWNAETDYDGMLIEQLRVRVNARAGNVPVPPVRMVLIPGGHFQMGAAESAHTVYISPMFMDRYEVTGNLWRDVKQWSATHGYSIGGGSYLELNHPAQDMTWYNAVKWCNARSERDGLTPVYYTDASQTEVYRSGDIALGNTAVKWSANGYRLPTEAEWEKGARGGLLGKEYPWGDGIDGSMANYSGASHPWTGSSPRTTPVGYYNGDQSVPGSDMANGYGLYDMAGNVWEWCWDWAASIPVGNNNPHGPDSGTSRLIRGGAWNSSTSLLRCAYRYTYTPSYDGYYTGFRCVRGL